MLMASDLSALDIFLTQKPTRSKFYINLPETKFEKLFWSFFMFQKTAKKGFFRSVIQYNISPLQA